MADIYEAYQHSLTLRPVNSLAPTVQVGGYVSRRRFRARVAPDTYAIATQANHQLLRQDFHLQETEQLSNRSKRDFVIQIAAGSISTVAV